MDFDNTRKRRKGILLTGLFCDALGHTALGLGLPNQNSKRVTAAHGVGEQEELTLRQKRLRKRDG